MMWPGSNSGSPAPKADTLPTKLSMWLKRNTMFVCVNALRPSQQFPNQSCRDVLRCRLDLMRIEGIFVYILAGLKLSYML